MHDYLVSTNSKFLRLTYTYMYIQLNYMQDLWVRHAKTESTQEESQNNMLTDYWRVATVCECSTQEYDICVWVYWRKFTITQ